MPGKKHIKAAVSALLVVLALWVATPKIYIHELFNHDHGTLNTSEGETRLKPKTPTDDCDLEKYNKPAYFNLFKFICSFIPSRSKTNSHIREKVFHLTGISFAVSLWRAPPAL